MAVSGINNTKKLLLKPFSVSGLRCMSRLGRPYQVKATNKDGEVRPAKDRQQMEDGDGCWMPHPRSGIYFPKGQEWVMDDIPTHAASFDCTFWLRNNDGVDDHTPQHNHDSRKI